ncbi:hypothetical protein CXF86_10920 [Shewanella sp. GutCb]|uniref:hypothetical protein n=1 Tax=Shewanella sp. GutCb TaxID=2058315 RepID=UPI000C7A52A3|nr:hypothetical protein [Shewanella sp. GutCb]PKG74795.1 hypothetical protein CXF86_10920 [Shewanella sp. GutCb]
MSGQLDELLNEVSNVVQASNAQTTASQALALEVAGKMGEIDAKADEVVDRLNLAMVESISTNLRKTLYLDVVSGDDGNDGETSVKAVQTLSRAIQLSPEFGMTTINVVADQIVIVDSDIAVWDKSIIVQLNGGVLEQVIKDGKAGRIREYGESRIRLKFGTVRTALLEDGFSDVTENSAFFSRVDNYATRLFVFSMVIDLGDLMLFSGGNHACDIHVLAISSTDLIFTPTAVNHNLAKINTNLFALQIGLSTLPETHTWPELIQGVVLAADGEPTNLLTNILFA